jgi:hypothetical protein
MNIFAWAETKIGQFTIFDITVMKLYLTCVGIIIGAYISPFVKRRIWAFAGLALVTAAWLTYRMFT